MRVYYVIDARPVERNNGNRVRGNVVAACLLPIDLGSEAFVGHALHVDDLPEDHPVMVSLLQKQANGENPIEFWPFMLTRKEIGVGDVIDELCDPAQRREP